MPFPLALGSLCADALPPSIKQPVCRCPPPLALGSLCVQMPSPLALGSLCADAPLALDILLFLALAIFVMSCHVVLYCIV